MKHLLRLVFLSSLSAVLGCSALASSSGTPTKISSLRPVPEGIQEMSKTLSRVAYTRALEGSRGAGNLRIVPLVVAANQAPSSPEYRIFNVKKGSVGEFLGLQNADVLIAAHEYVIRDPGQFYAYLQALVAQGESQIEIRRDTKPILIKYTFID